MSRPLAPRRTIPIKAAADAPGAEGLTRRSALQLMAASMALASGACSRPPSEHVYPYVDMPEGARGGLPAYYASALVRDGYAYGVLVGTREGRPIKIEGNPAHPASLGASDAFMQASVLELWDPDRSQSVWQRLAPATRTMTTLAASAFPHEPAAAAPSTWSAFAAAWREQATRLASVQGHGLAVLTPSFTSPSLALQLRALLRRFPRARWHRDSPFEPSAARAGARLAFGSECDWLFHFDRCRFVLSLAADPFSDGPGKLRHARDWATQRAGTGPGEAARAADPPRSLAIEIRPGLFGARADERIAMAPAAIERLVEALAAQLQANASAAPAVVASLPAHVDSALATRIAATLRAAGSAGLVLAGASLSERTHAQVAAINIALGAVGHTLEPIEPLDALGDVVPGDLAGLVHDMNNGGVDTLLVVGANPVYDAPGAMGFADALRRVSFSAHLGLYRDETAQATSWHLPASHDYESWGDARAHDGTATIVQPAILPLYDTRSPLEWVAFLGSGEEGDGHTLVQETWRRSLAVSAPASVASTKPPSPAEAAPFDAWWHRTLRAGFVEGSAAPRLALSLRALLASVARAPAPDGLVAVFDADPCTDTGRFSNNGWLQELPRPFTAMTWGNAVQVGPKTAARLGLDSGDIVRIGAGNAAVEGPIWILAEHAEEVLSLPLGYGRRAAGRVGDGVGFDANTLRTIDGAPVPVTVARTGRRHRFAVTQRRLDQQGRELARSVVAGAALPAPTAHPSLYPPVEPGEHAWAMTIDLDACIGCNACTIACQAENNIPVVGAEEVARGREMHWIRVDRYAGEGGTAGIFQPVPCMHCEEAPCEVVCPVGATVHDSDGLNVQVYNRCVGTRFCSNNCPYKVRRFNFLKHDDGGSETLKALRNPDVTVRQRGVMEKCTYCVQRLTRARLVAEEAGTAIADGDVVTACQSACPTQAIHFGDLRDASSDVVRSKASPRHYAMLEELGTRPRTTYLARVVRATVDSPDSSETPR